MHPFTERVIPRPKGIMVNAAESPDGHDQPATHMVVSEGLCHKNTRCAATDSVEHPRIFRAAESWTHPMGRYAW